MSVVETWGDYFEKLLNTNQCAKEERELETGTFLELEDGERKMTLNFKEFLEVMEHISIE